MLTKNFSEVFQRSNTVEIKKKKIKNWAIKGKGILLHKCPV